MAKHVNEIIGLGPSALCDAALAWAVAAARMAGIPSSGVPRVAVDILPIPGADAAVVAASEDAARTVAAYLAAAANGDLAGATELFHFQTVTAALHLASAVLIIAGGAGRYLTGGRPA